MTDLVLAILPLAAMAVIVLAAHVRMRERPLYWHPIADLTPPTLTEIQETS